MHAGLNPVHGEMNNQFNRKLVTIHAFAILMADYPRTLYPSTGRLVDVGSSCLTGQGEVWERVYMVLRQRSMSR